MTVQDAGRPGTAWRQRLAGPAAAYRLGVVLRLLAAVPGGYALAALFSAVFSTALPLPRLEAVLTATMASFLVFTGAVVWAFAARSVAWAWGGIAIPAALLGLAWLGQGLPA